jgi:hypothetical protein
MPYLLTSETFQMVDGPYKGKKYQRGKQYSDIPPTEKKRFKFVGEASKPRPEVVPPKGGTDKPAGKPVAKKNEGSDDKPKTSARSGALTVPEKQED